MYVPGFKFCKSNLDIFTIKYCGESSYITSFIILIKKIKKMVIVSEQDKTV